ncbi:MAG TPA: DUF427 domain-containing protein [Acidimicrobiales bacterium]
MSAANGRYLRAAQYGEEGGEIVWAEETARRVRVFFGGTAVADSNNVMILFNGRRVPIYFFPRSDVRTDLFEASPYVESDPRLGSRCYESLIVGEHRGENAVFGYREAIPEGPDLSDFVTFVWDAMDSWFEEDEQILRHARDPYKRVDVLQSSRHVVVRVADTVVADTHRPMLLFETGLPVRYYVPKLDVRLDLLTPTATRSRCPYKGEASYWSLDANGQHLDDVVWSYPAPIPEIPKIENLLAFYNEKVDIEIDGVAIDRPKTPWS